MTMLLGPLADDLWRIGHEDTTGNPWIDADSMGLGLAAGLLGELWLGRHVRIGQGRLEVAVEQPSPVDGLGESIVRLLAREASDFTLASWLSFLARDSYEQVTRRLAEAGHVRPQRRGLTGSAWVATDTSRALAPALRLRFRLGKGYPLVSYELALLGLLSACGLEKALLYPANTPGVLRERLAEWLRWPDMPPALADLVKHTRAAAGRAVLTARHPQLSL
ncbi:GPP34 family phosphoprotein [Phytohabitans sp. ZYX-F-186]|uniref:GPP34 family phosphoprotein n=1 Tax=Phytohabitans maris TaxID=3071409 RepID=A0ABU0ZS82_9ACTN|nr:GPP34 family phosphoprotein [Phytohabitans sp. ZYX-F-186]MDQ7909110.1 GPP34 family phosphoprotein [Phytohabitans sp. ZYX-F-186]